MGTFFPLGGSDLRLGGGGLSPQICKNFAWGDQKKKKGHRFFRKVFNTWKKLPYPPTSFGRRYGGPWGGVYTPHTPPRLCLAGLRRMTQQGTEFQMNSSGITRYLG